MLHCNTLQVILPTGQLHTIHCNHLVNASGAWAQRLALMASIGQKDHPNMTMRTDLPVRPRKRCVFVFKCPSGPTSDCPLVADPSGYYFRREGMGSRTFLCGYSPTEVRYGIELMSFWSIRKHKMMIKV